MAGARLEATTIRHARVLRMDRNGLTNTIPVTERHGRRTVDVPEGAVVVIMDPEAVREFVRHQRVCELELSKRTKSCTSANAATPEGITRHTEDLLLIARTQLRCGVTAQIFSRASAGRPLDNPLNEVTSATLNLRF